MRNSVNKTSATREQRSKITFNAACKTSKAKELNLIYSISCQSNERHLRRILPPACFFLSARVIEQNKYNIFAVNIASIIVGESLSRPISSAGKKGPDEASQGSKANIEVDANFRGNGTGVADLRNCGEKRILF
jgi:hypothetical protein